MPPTGAARAKFYFQIVSTPTSDTPGTTILLHFDNKRYLFGRIAEGTQRACVQRGIKLKQVREIFVTGRPSWSNIGGLLGMVLTIADVQKLEGAGEEPAEKPRLGIRGAALLTHAIACGRRFIFRTGMPISVTEFEDSERVSLEEPSWSDDNIQVWAVPAYRSTQSSQNGSAEADSDTEPFSDSDSASSPRKRKHDEFENSNVQNSTIPLNPNNQAIRQSIVSEMFESSWRHDKLVETTWAEVRHPAQMFIRDPKTHSLIPFKFPPTASVPEDQKVLVREPWPATLLTELPAPPRNFSRPAMSYIIRGYPQRGSFDPKKAFELGVPRGPLYRQLASGIPLTLENGNVVRPEMVLGPTKPGRGIAILDLSHQSLIDSLLSRPEWRSENILHGVEAICWILGQGVTADPRVQNFMKSFPNIQHIISSPDTCPDYLAMDSSAASAIRLSRISRDHFPVPAHDNITIPQIAPDRISTPSMFDSSSDARAAERGLKIQVEPKFELQRDEVATWLDAAQAIKSIPQKAHELAVAARMEITQSLVPHASQSSHGISSAQFSDYEVITLGTGSALPSKYRNVSATLLRIPGKGSYLFDCGENTIGQLLRVFGPKNVADVLLDLKLIWISHLHADHHLGTLGVLAAYKSARGALPAEERRGKKICIASEEKMMSFLDDFSCLSSRYHYLKYLVCTPWSQPTVNGNRANFHKLGLPIKDFATVGVKHCWGAQAVSITFDDGFKFSYSGDCRPSNRFAATGKDSDVLVHEATFDDGKEGDAMAKKHSTTGEALAVASLMKAKNVILTHFSQRYQKIPVMGNVKLPQQIKFEDDSPSEEAAAGPVDKAMDMDVFPEYIAGGSVIEDSLEASSASTKEINGRVPEDELAKSMNWTSQATQELKGVAAEAEHVPSTATGASPPRDLTFAVPPGDLQTKPAHEMNICVAFDYMRVRVSDIKHMSKFTPALTALFESEHPEIADVPATEQDRNAMINNTGRKLNHPRHSLNVKEDLQVKTQRQSSSNTDSSGSENSRRAEKKERKMEARREKRKRPLAGQQKAQDERLDRAGPRERERETARPQVEHDLT